MNPSTKADLHAALEGTSVTDGWDVMVSYSQDHLNNLLRGRWSQSPTFDNITFTRSSCDRMGAYTKCFTAKLGAPDLQFETSSDGVARARLEMPLTAKYYYSDNVDNVKEIPPDKYRFVVNVPLVSMKGDQIDEHTDNSKVIHFDDGNDSSYYLVFHFENQQTISEILFLGSTDHEDLDLDLDEVAAREIHAWLKSRENIRWIDYKVAHISNNRAVSDSEELSDLLKPVSFCFSSQPGALNVFIQTTHPNSGQGRAPPRFNHKSNSPMLPVPSGYEACIFISHRLFVDDYLIPQMKEKLSESLATDRPIISNPLTSGIGLTIPLNKKQKFQLSEFWSPMFSPVARNRTVKPIIANFKENPLILKITDDQQNARASWSWDFSIDVDWSEILASSSPSGMGGGTSSSLTLGRVRLASHVRSPKKEILKNSSLADSKLALKISFEDSDQPVMEEPVGLWRETGFLEHLSKTPPKGFSDVRIRLDEFSIEFPTLDFFTTQNVFTTNDRFIEVSDVMVPHDVVLMGRMTAVANTGQ